MIEELKELFIRDLDKLRNEISQYSEESKIWVIDGQITNSAGNLILHLCGNLKHFIGAQLGSTGYIREREREFADKNISVDKLLRNVSEAMEVVENTLNKLNEKELEAVYPTNIFDRDVSIRFMLIHLYGHLNYHLGQINYHRRFFDTKL